MTNFRKEAYGQFGVGLGYVIILTGLAARFIPEADFNVGRLIYDVKTHLVFYIFVMGAAPFLLGFFGFYAGLLIERNEEKQKVLEGSIRAMEISTSSLKEVNDTLSKNMVIDPVTGLYNRHQLILLLEKELQRIRRSKITRPVAYTLMIDIDDFKKINDTHGHFVGDFVLKAVGQTIKRSIRTYDSVGRYGGDEFLVLMPEVSLDGAKKIAARIQENIALHDYQVGEEKLDITLSIGLASSEDASGDTLSMVNRADQFLLAAKKNGKNRVIAA